MEQLERLDTQSGGSSEITGPAWDNTTEYAGVGAPDMMVDVERAQLLTAQLAVIGEQVSPHVERADQVKGDDAQRLVALAQEASKLHDEAFSLLWNVSTFLNCELSVDGKNAAAKTLLGKIETASSKLAQANNPVTLFLKLTSKDVVDAYLQAAHTAPERFSLEQNRKLKDQTLSLKEESLIIGLGVDGKNAWGGLYTTLSSSITAKVKLPDGEKSMGLAQTAALSQDPCEEVRKAGWLATNEAWTAHEETVASILNALSGWRHETYRRRSYQVSVDFLDAPLHSARISRATLDAMLNAVRTARPLGQKVVQLQAKLLGKTQLGPWDLFAPPPVLGQGKAFPKQNYDAAIDLIAKANATINPEMGDFVRLMNERRWIEGTVGPTKRTGAYCTKFVKSRTPRVYMTYTGGMRELKTLAHELGHAFHNWVMRDMPLVETFYPMTLAETASIFGETVFNGALLEAANDPAERLPFVWAEAREVESLLLNIPARFEFEKALYERRLESTVTPDDLRQMMTSAWSNWYGDSLSEMDSMFWASKLHFSIAGLSFYNFPYTFGYLFALGVYAQRAKLGKDFYEAYVSLLRDTGRMTAEALAKKHLGVDLTKPGFWLDSLKISAQAVESFESTVQELS